MITSAPSTQIEDTYKTFSKALCLLELLSDEPLEGALLLKRENALKTALMLLNSNAIDMRQVTGEDLINATKAGNVELLDLMLAKGVNVNLIGEYGETALFHARNQETIDCLLKYHVDLFYNKKRFHTDALSFMRLKLQLGINHFDPKLIDYLKKHMAFEQAKVDSFYENIITLLSGELKAAKAKGKKLLIILGELHYDYRSYKVEKIIGDVACELGIKTLYGELDEERIKAHINIGKSGKYSAKLLGRAKNKKGMTVEGVDRHHALGSKDNDNAVALRDLGMIDEILGKPKRDAILIIGGSHLEGILNKSTTIREKYTVIPLNLVKIIHERISWNSDRADEFMYNEDNVIQVGPSLTFSFSQASKVIKRWNFSTSETDTERLECQAKEKKARDFEERELLAQAKKLRGLEPVKVTPPISPPHPTQEDQYNPTQEDQYQSVKLEVTPKARQKCITL